MWFQTGWLETQSITEKWNHSVIESSGKGYDESIARIQIFDTCTWKYSILITIFLFSCEIAHRQSLVYGSAERSLSNWILGDKSL